MFKPISFCTRPQIVSEKKFGNSALNWRYKNVETLRDGMLSKARSFKLISNFSGPVVNIFINRPHNILIIIIDSYSGESMIHSSRRWIKIVQEKIDHGGRDDRRARSCIDNQSVHKSWKSIYWFNICCDTLPYERNKLPGYAWNAT